jgi:hypothetical protein
MLGLSLALHAGLALCVALFDFHVQRATSPESTPQKAANLVLIPSDQAPHARQPAPMQKALPVLSQAPVQHEEVAKPTTVTVVAHPKTGVPVLSPESILCPSHASRLNPAGAVVFLLDVSGSMYEPFAGSYRLAFAREELTRRIRALADGTPFAITIYGEIAHTSGPLVAASNATRDAAIRYLNEEFNYGGGTNFPAGLASAQRLHPGSFVLVTDGDLNIETTDLLGKTALIMGTSGQQLSVVGIAPRPDTDAETQLHALADQEGGAYVEETPEAVSSAAPSPTEAQPPSPEVESKIAADEALRSANPPQQAASYKGD